MSTNEQNKTQEINRNENEKFESVKFLENQSSNSAVESETNSEEKSAETEAVDVGDFGLVETEHYDGKRENFCENPPVNSRIAENVGRNQTTGEKENLLFSEESNFPKVEKISGSAGENSDPQKSAMSRSNAKSRLPNKTTSRPALSNGNSKVPGELSGQPSVRNAKDDLKYWRNREQELLSKISELESKVSSQESTRSQESDTVRIAAIGKERDNYKCRNQSNDKESSGKQKEIPAETNFKSGKGSDEVINHLKLQNEDLRNALAKMTAILRDKTTMCISQEKKNAALVNQVESLKEVVAITKDLLNIRNMEVQHLSNDINAMETKIDCERQRHNQMLVKMDEAVKLNSDLKKEYENQLRLFQHLRDSYEKKIDLLSRDGKNSEKKENLHLDKEIINSNKANSDSQVQNLSL